MGNLTIDTLIEDVENLLVNGTDEIPDELFEQFGKAVAQTVKQKLSAKGRQTPPSLRMSNIGSPCFRKTYLQIKYPEEQIPMKGSDYLKFLYGDLIEELMIFLASVSGHKVEGMQDTLNISGVNGHRDVVIDGVLIDVKSTSSISFKKFKEHRLLEDDPFGYHVQLQSYLHASQDDDIVTDKDRAAFWAIDKTLGHQCLDFYPKMEWDMKTGYDIKIEQLGQDTPPEKEFQPVKEGESGNMKLPMFCSYCNVKHKCYEGEKIRTFLSYKGPVYMTTVKREPRMVEIDLNGDKIEKED